MCKSKLSVSIGLTMYDPGLLSELTFSDLNGNRCCCFTCQRISTDVVVCGVTERMVGASSGAEERKVRQISSIDLKMCTIQSAKSVHALWHSANTSTQEPKTEEPLNAESQIAKGGGRHYFSCL